MANYPSSKSTTSDLHTAVNNLSTALDGAIDNSVTTITVVTTTGFPSVGAITIDAERISYTGTTATTFTGCTRGFGGTSADSHTDTTPVLQTYGAEYHNDNRDEVIAIGDDLVNSISADLDDSVTPATTASSIEQRFDHIATAIKNTTGETDWKTVPTNDLSDKANDSDVVKLTGDQSVGGIKTTTSSFHPDAGIFGSAGLSGTTLAFETRNTSDTASSDAVLRATVAGTSAGDAFSRYDIISGGTWTAGIDNSDGDHYKISNNATLGTNDVLVSGSTLGTQIKGTATNDSATAGWVGEEIRSNDATNTNFPTTGTFSDALSISLTAGDWDVSCLAVTNTATSSTTTFYGFGISTTSGNSTTGLVVGDNYINESFTAPAASNKRNYSIPNYRMSLSSTTTVYLKFRGDYSSGQPIVQGMRLSARRVR